MPTPRKNERRNDFVDRCMSDGESRRDFPDRRQRLAFCNSQFERKKKKSQAGRLYPANLQALLAQAIEDAQKETEKLESIRNQPIDTASRYDAPLRNKK